MKEVEGLPRFDETKGPFSLASQFIEFSWDKDAKQFDNAKVALISDIAGTAIQTEIFRDDHARGHLRGERKEAFDQLSLEQKKGISRRKTLYWAALEMLNIAKFEHENNVDPNEALKKVEESFWLDWKLKETPHGKMLAHYANDVRLSDGDSSIDNHLLIVNIAKALANGAKLPKKGKIIDQPAGLEGDDISKFSILIDPGLFAKIERKFRSGPTKERE